jgi:uncharacterized membrane protein YkoI
MRHFIAMTLAAALFTTGAAVSAVDAADKAPRTEQKMSLEQVPAPVRATFEKEAKGGTIGDVVLETDPKGKTYYEAHIQQPKGKDRYVQVSADGKVLKRHSARKEARQDAKAPKTTQ